MIDKSKQNYDKGFIVSHAICIFRGKIVISARLEWQMGKNQKSERNEFPSDFQVVYVEVKKLTACGCMRKGRERLQT